MILSIHIPKCGGTSFRHVLREIYGPALWLNYGAIFSQPQAQRSLLPAGTRCIHGHFLANAFDELVPQPDLVTWLRHPVQRVVSNYFHFLRSPDLRDDGCRELLEQNLSLEKFAELDWMRNEATRYLSGKPVEAFRFIGIMERFEESLGGVGRIFRVPVSARLPRVNLNPDRASETYRISDRTHAHILALNLRDLAAYVSAGAALDRLTNSTRSQAG